MWFPTSSSNSRTYGSENLSPMPQKDFCNSIGTFETCRMTPRMSANRLKTGSERRAVNVTRLDPTRTLMVTYSSPSLALCSSANSPATPRAIPARALLDIRGDAAYFPDL